MICLKKDLKKANKKITSIAWYDKQVDEWGIVVLDEKNHFGTNIKTKTNKKIIPCRDEGRIIS